MLTVETLLQVARTMRAEIAAELGEIRAAASRPVPAAGLRRAFHEARCALEAVRSANGSGPGVASHRDLGAFRLLTGRDLSSPRDRIEFWLALRRREMIA